MDPEGAHLLTYSRVVVSVSTSRSRDVFFKRLGLVSVSAKCGKVSVSSRTESQMSRSRLGLGPQRLVYKWTFKQIFQFLSFSYKTNMSDICFFIHSLVICVSVSLKVALTRSKIPVMGQLLDGSWVTKCDPLSAHCTE